MERLEQIYNERLISLSASSDEVKNVRNIVIGQMQELHKRQKTANRFFVRFMQNEKGHIWLMSNMIPEKDFYSVSVDTTALSKLVCEWRSATTPKQCDAYETYENGFKIWYFEYCC